MSIRLQIRHKQTIRHVLEEFLFFWRPSLGRRLTVAFTIFGLIIGYLSFLFLAVLVSRDFIGYSTSLIEQRLFTLTRAQEADGLLALINRRQPDIAETADLIKMLTSRSNAVSSFSLYYRNAADLSWHQLYIDRQNIFRTRPVAGHPDLPALKRSVERRFVSSAPLFWGWGDRVRVKMNITRPIDRNVYILGLDINRRGIFTVLRTNSFKAGMFALLLLIISHLLGHLFSRRLVRPIHELSDSARAMAAGDLNQVFLTRNHDEIGILADTLNHMAARVRDDIQAREDLLLGVLLALTRSIDAKSSWTAGHSERVTDYAMEIVRHLDLSPPEQRTLRIAAILHDIGKIAVPEAILDKPGALTAEEMAVIRCHPRQGADIIADIPAYREILPGVLHHHERWDGTGYPEGLTGEDIPLIARIITVADVYDAVSAARPYRAAWPPEKTQEFFVAERGKAFDPAITDIFLTCRLNPGSMNKRSAKPDA